MPGRRYGWGIVVAVVAGLDAGAAAQTMHEIRLDRPLAPGQRLHVQAAGSTVITTTVTSEGREQEIGAVEFDVSFESEMEVLKVDEHGRPTRAAHTIIECVLHRPGRQTTIVPHGDTLIATRGTGRTTFFAKKRRFDDVMQQALELVAGLDAYLAGEDELFGTSRSRRVGESWPINNEALAAEFQRYTRQRVDEDDIRGVSTLAGIRNHAGRPCQVVRTEITARGALPGFDETPPGTRMKRAELSVVSFKLLPFNVREPWVADNMSMDVNASFQGSLGSQVVQGRITGHIEARHEIRAQSAPTPHH